MEELERRLREKGAVQGSLIIEQDNYSARALYEEMGYEFFKDVCYMRKRLPQTSSTFGHKACAPIGCADSLLIFSKTPIGKY